MNKFGRSIFSIYIFKVKQRRNSLSRGPTYIYSLLKLFFQTSKVEWQEASGLREKIRGEMNLVQKEMTSLRTKQESQQQLIENQLRSVSTIVSSVVDYQSRVYKIR